ncbi:hypothetical protein ACFV6E_00225 [Streptomyces sp. NPDC059785]
MRHPVGVAVRDTVIAALSVTAPGLFLRGLDGIADRRPAGRPYASRVPAP